MKDNYYKKNKKEWRKGGKYYYYKPKETEYRVTIKRGEFWILFN
tara:strand:- start:471 stop:602 length:132 start_codon:yes stop_codon:yes gene_type:complete